MREGAQNLGGSFFPYKVGKRDNYKEIP